MTTGLYKSSDAAGDALNTIYAEDVGQLIDVLTGQRDGGALSLLPPLASPASAPAVTTSAGSLTGTYKWQVYWISGIMDGTATAHVVGRTPAGPATSGTALSSQRATLDISGLTPPTGVIGWGVARTQAGGSTFLLVPGSEQFLSAAGSLPATFVDNTADGSLVTAVQTVNTTGTTFVGSKLAHTEITSSVGPTTSADAITMTSDVNCDLYGAVIVELYTVGLIPQTSSGISAALYESTDSGSTWTGRGILLSTNGSGIARRKLTSLTGNRRWKITLSGTNSGGTLTAGDGTGTNNAPAYLAVYAATP